MGIKKKIIIIAVCGVLAITGVITAIVTLVKPNKEDPEIGTDEPGIVLNVGDNFHSKIESIYKTEGTGDELFYNETTRQEYTPFVVYVEADPETGEEKTYATFFLNYADKETITENGEEKEVDLLRTEALSIQLSAETIALLNKPGTQEEIIAAIQKDLDAKNNDEIQYINNYAGIELDDAERAALSDGIRNSLLAKPESFVGYTENATITLLNTYRDDQDGTYNVFGMITEGMNSQYFMFNRKINNMEEYLAARDALKSLVKGGKFEDVGYSITSQADLDNEIIVFEIDGKTYTYKSGMIVALWQPQPETEATPEVSQ